MSTIGTQLFSGWGFKRQRGLVRLGIKCSPPYCSFGIQKNYFLGQKGIVTRTWTGSKWARQEMGKVKEITSDYILTDNDELVVCSGTFTIYLPYATGSGDVYTICNEGVGTITLSCKNGETLKGSATQTISAGSDLIIRDYKAGKWV